MINKSIIFFHIIVLLFSSSVYAEWTVRENVHITQSAQGWNAKPGPPDPECKYTVPSTIIVNPKGIEFNIGMTQYPDSTQATLWLIKENIVNGFKQINYCFICLITNQ